MQDISDGRKIIIGDDFNPTKKLEVFDVLTTQKRESEENVISGGISSGQTEVKTEVKIDIKKYTPPLEMAVYKNIAYQTPPEPATVSRAPMSGEETELREKFSTARADYFSELVQYEKNLREKRNQFEKNMKDLGKPERQMPELEKSTSFIQAEKIYRGATHNLEVKIQKEKKETILARLGRAENRFSVMRGKIANSYSPLEKGIFSKNDVWAKSPMPARLTFGALCMRVSDNADVIPIIFSASSSEWENQSTGTFERQTVRRPIDGVRIKRENSEVIGEVNAEMVSTA